VGIEEGNFEAMVDCWERLSLAALKFAQMHKISGIRVTQNQEAENKKKF
jgi:hypothetical protein